ncbi:MAG: hypothetical protein EA420_16295 [Candidatus Competibacteraceae bacterium]|nr:MAG: hypothetical protein EA420_16295 [Candidatus Competibacteraceae bacterium]
MPMTENVCPLCEHENPGDALVCAVCGTRLLPAAAQPMALAPGAALDGGRYRIERVIGRGGFGMTYVGLARGVRRVAIKECFPEGCARIPGTEALLPGGDDFPRQLERFRREAAQLDRLHHDHIVRLRDHFEANGTAYLVMDLIDGEGLEHRIARRAFAAAEARRLLGPLLDALEYLHGKDVWHLDVKPQNIVLRPDGGPVLVDFGAARDGPRSHSTRFGTEGYAPIEQDSTELPRGPWSDVYGLGATLYHMVAGQAPPRAVDLLAGRRLAFPDRLDPALRQAIDAAMRPRPEERLPDMGALRAALAGESGGTERREGPRSEEPARNARTDRGESALGVGEADWADIPAGEFLMGSPESEEGRDSDERPHRVRVAAFQMLRTPVTFAMYDAFCAATGREPPKDQGWGRADRPVINVSYWDAVDYADWLSGATGWRCRLPTEAEWEYACRAGTTTPFWTGNALTTKQANYNGSVVPYGGAPQGLYREKTTPVRLFPANPWGLHDMHGNVWEWCASEYDPGYAGLEQGDASGDRHNHSFRVLRGGSWNLNARSLRCAQRNWFYPVYRILLRGFRLARI